MTIEEQAFLYRRFVPEQLTVYGFTKQDGGFYYQTDFMDGAFRAEISVTDAGTVSGTVIDLMNGEEYAPLKNEQFDGAYVHAVRGAYEALLMFRRIFRGRATVRAYSGTRIQGNGSDSSCASAGRIC